MIRSFLSFFLAISLVGGATAQDQTFLPCRNNDMDLLRPLHQDDPVAFQLMAASTAELEEFTRNFVDTRSDRDDATYIVPVVFHIIHSNGAENILDEQIIDGMRILNEDFRRLNPDWQNVNSEFLDIAADTGIEFRLARKDPQGNCTTGITRTVSNLTHVGDQAMKSLIQWPRNRYLNIWVAASANGAAGYAMYPGTAHNFPAGDGIVLQHSYVGSIGTGSPQRSRALTHEVGHWINLAHTWGNSNSPGLASNCDGDDGVDDTPNTRGWTSCNVNGSSCGSLDNVENFMEYSYCSKMFTSGQATRMIAALNATVAQRNQLWTPANMTFTGVLQEGQLCEARFEGDGGLICAGSTVSFLDMSFHNVVSRIWEFPGGTPSTSTDPDPVITYNEGGIFPVTLTVSDGSASLTTTQEAFVKVLPVPGNAVPFFEGFENISQLHNSDWIVKDEDGGNTFAITNTVAYSGERSVRIINNPLYNGQVDELHSTTFDMSNVDNISISFRYAYARRNEGNDDRLRVFVSSNCGNHWSLRRQLRGSQELSTSPNQTTSFVPSSPDQWGYATVDNIPVSNHVGEFRFMFRFESNGGNNLYIDDININGFPVSVEELGSASNSGIMVVPNPTAGQGQLVFDLKEVSSTRIAIMDVLGREITVLQEGTLASGPQRIDLPVATLPSGMYFVSMNRNGMTEVVRFVVK